MKSAEEIGVYGGVCTECDVIIEVVVDVDVPLFQRHMVDVLDFV